MKTIRLISGAGGGISLTRSTWLHAHPNKLNSVRKEKRGRDIGWTSNNVSTDGARPF